MIRRVLTVDYLLTQLKKPTILTPWGRFKIDENDNYKGSMSSFAEKNTNLSNHDHCGGELCKFPPTPPPKNK